MARGKSAPGQRGLTLIEAVIALAVLAVLISVALPYFGQMLHRQRLKAAAETLASDLAEARFDAARRGLPVHLAYAGGPRWCYAVATAPGCDCQTARPCALKTVRAADLPGVALLESQDARIEASGVATVATRTVLGTKKGERLLVSLSALGRASVCAPGGQMTGYPRC